MHGQKTHKGSFPSIFRNAPVWGNKKTAGSRGSLTLRQMTAHSLDIWFPFSVSRFLISDIRFLSSVFWFPFSVCWFLTSVFWFLASVFCLLASVLWYLLSDTCLLMSAFWYLSSDVCFLFSGFCYLISVLWYLFSVFLSHTPLSKKTAHLINKICCPYCHAFSELRIDLSAF